jgi:hypothetical protein
VKLNRDVAKILGPERAALLEPLVNKKFFRTLALGKLYEVANAQVCSRLTAMIFKQRLRSIVGEWRLC